MKKMNIKLTTCVCLCACYLFAGVIQAQIKVTNGGNVGIGLGATETPANKLQVNGNTLLKSLQVNENTTLKSLQVSENTILQSLQINEDFSFSGFKPYKANSTLYQVPSSAGNLYTLDLSYLITDYKRQGVIGSTRNPFWEINAIHFKSRLGNPYAEIIYDPYVVNFDHNYLNFEAEDVPTDRFKGLNIIRYTLKDGVYEDVENEILKKICTESYCNKPVVGLVPQEVMEQFPELVSFDKETGSYAIDYVSFVPYLIQTIKEQAQRIEKMEVSLYGYNPKYEPKSFTAPAAV